MTYDDFVEQVVEICDRNCESFDSLVDDYSFREAFKKGMSPKQAFDDACHQG